MYNKYTDACCLHYVVSKVHNHHVCINQWHRKMISSGVAKKTMRAEIAISSEQHKGWPATPVPMPLINILHKKVHTEVECTVHYAALQLTVRN